LNKLLIINKWIGRAKEGFIYAVLGTNHGHAHRIFETYTVLKEDLPFLSEIFLNEPILRFMTDGRDSR
jgi:hypothetical protein